MLQHKLSFLALASMTSMLLWHNLHTPMMGSQEGAHAHVKVIIFDLDGVLTRTSRLGIAKHCIGSSALQLLQQKLHGDHIQSRLYRLLEHMQPTSPDDHTTYDPQEKLLPAILSNWMAGHDGYDSASVIQHVQAYLRHTDISHSQMRMYLDLIHAVCDPDLRGKHTYCYHTGYRLLRYLQRAFPNCTFAILSNYDDACFQHIYHSQRLHHMFARFKPEHIFISAHMGMVKPETNIYYTVCDRLGVAPSECLVIDDQEVNLVAARKVGMHTCHFTGDIHDALRTIQNCLHKRCT